MKKLKVITTAMTGQKNILLLLFVLSFAGPASAQLFVGPVLGPQVHRVQFFEPTARKQFKSLPSPGFYGGLMASMKVRNQFYLTGSLIYSQKGKLTKSKDDPRYRNHINMHYLEMPIYYTLEFTEKTPKSTGKGGLIKTYKWFVGAGPTISYWLGGKGKIKSSNLYENKVDLLKYKIIFNKVDEELTDAEYGNKMNVETPNRLQFGINITGGVAFEPVGLHKIMIAGHLELGQTFISKESKGYFPKSFIDVDILKGKYQGFRLSLAYLFDTKISERSKGRSNDSDMKRVRRKRR